MINSFTKREKLKVCFALFMFILLNFFNLFIEKIFAETMPYSSAYLNAKQCVLNCNVQGSNCFLDLDTCVWDSNNNIGSSITFGSLNGYLDKIEFNIVDTGDYMPGNYSLIFNWGIDPRALNEWNNKYIIHVYGSRNNSNDIELNSNCSTSLGTGNYDFNTSCSFSTLDKYDHFKIVFVYVGAGCTFDSTYNEYTCPNNNLFPQLTNAMSFNRINSFEFDDNPTNAINNQTTIINSSINNINDSINDDSIDNPNDYFEDMDDYLPSNGVISSLLALPITLYSKVLNSINGTCQSFNLGSLYGTNLIMPCIEMQNYLGSNLWNLIDILFSGFFILTIANKFIKVFNNFTFLKEGDVLKND